MNLPLLKDCSTGGKLHKIKLFARKNKKLIKIVLIAVGIFGSVIFKFFYYDGIITCKPMKYRGTIIGTILGYDLKKGESRKDLFDQQIPVGMPASDLITMLEEQKIKFLTGHTYKYAPVPSQDYVISFRVEYTCIYGDYLPGFRVWIKDGKVFMAEFYVERSFI